MKEENEKKVKKEKTIKQIIFSRIIFVLILTAIVVGVLYYLIMQNKADEQIAVNNEVYENTTLENNEVEDYKKVKKVLHVIICYANIYEQSKNRCLRSSAG